MKGHTKENPETRQRLMAAAGANIAAVNYHFGSKETLYVEAWRYSFAASIQAHPPDGGVGPEAPPEERLRGQVRGLLTRISDKNDMEFPIVQKERANPTGLLQEVMKKELSPLRVRTESVIRDLLGPHASERDIRFCAVSILGQCIDPIAIDRANLGRRKRGGGEPVTAGLEAYIHHVVRFSLAGIRAIYEESEVEMGREGRRLSERRRRAKRRERGVTHGRPV